MAAAKKGAAPQAAPKAVPVATAAAPVADRAPDAATAEGQQPLASATAGDGETPDAATAETIKPAQGEVFVLVRKGLDRFHRCGMRFTREPTVLVVAELPEGVLERLKGEPSLVVVEG